MGRENCNEVVTEFLLQELGGRGLPDDARAVSRPEPLPVHDVAAHPGHLADGPPDVPEIRAGPHVLPVRPVSHAVLPVTGTVAVAFNGRVNKSMVKNVMKNSISQALGVSASDPNFLVNIVSGYHLENGRLPAQAPSINSWTACFTYQTTDASIADR